MAVRVHPTLGRDELGGEVKETNGGDSGGIVEARSTPRSSVRASEKCCRNSISYLVAPVLGNESSYVWSLATGMPRFRGTYAPRSRSNWRIDEFPRKIKHLRNGWHPDFCGELAVGIFGWTGSRWSMGGSLFTGGDAFDLVGNGREIRSWRVGLRFGVTYN